MVILDLVVTDTPGFLAEMNRLVVATSRARDGLYIIASKRGIDNFKKRTGRYIKRYLSTILPFRCPIEDEVIQSDFYTKGDMKSGIELAIQGAGLQLTLQEAGSAVDKPADTVVAAIADATADNTVANNEQPWGAVVENNNMTPNEAHSEQQTEEAWGAVIDTPMEDQPAKEWVDQPVGQPTPDHGAW